jgi:NAD(P)-dependent dehydrogenase (short-subunit alcohol dehydrogenase family)
MTDHAVDPTRSVPAVSPSDPSAPVAIITGAGSGIGRCTAATLARAGFRVVLIGRTAESLVATRDALPEGSESEVVPADVADPDSSHEIIKSAIDRFGRLDAIINNAASAPLLPIEQHTPEIIEAIFRTNTIGPACLIAAAWPIFKQQHSTGRAHPLGATIVNVSTLGTRDPFPGFFGYASSKAALNLMVKSAASEGREFNIRAYAIAPGAVETDMLRAIFSHDILPSSQCLSAERVAEELAACALGERLQYNGQVIFMSASAGVFTG